jgi:hypothetical protein
MFIVTLIALPMPGVTGAQVTVTPIYGSPVVLSVQAGQFTSATIAAPESIFGFKTTLEVGGHPISSARVENVSSDGSFHVQVIGPAKLGGRPFGIGHITHSFAQQSVVLVCDGPPPRRQTCPGSLTCDDYTLTC